MSETNVAIVGVGEARIGRDAGCSSWELHVEAAQAALADAGLSIADVDGLISCPSTVDDHARHHVLLAEQLGMPFKRYTESSRVGGASSTSAVRDAVTVIQAGLAECVLITCADSQRTYVSRVDSPAIKMAHYHSADYEIPYGPLIISLYALVMQRWMHEYGWTAEQIAEVPVAQRHNAGLHPNAQVREPITIDDVVKSKPITLPLRLLDCSLISDGGAALIVAGGDVAKELERKGRAAYIHGMGGAYSYYFMWNLPDYTDYLRGLIRTSVDQAFAQSGLTRDDIDFGMVGDPADICTLIGLEGMGYAPPGEGVDFAAGGALKVGGRLPINTHGGCLSYAHPGAPGQHLHLIEAVRQLRGECGDRQVKDARFGLVHGQAGVVTSHCTLILGKEAKH